MVLIKKSNSVLIVSFVVFLINPLKVNPPVPPEEFSSGLFGSVGALVEFTELKVLADLSAIL